MRTRLVLVAMLAGCVDRTIEPEVDYSEDVERICEGFCAMDMACLEDDCTNEPIVGVGDDEGGDDLLWNCGPQ